MIDINSAMQSHIGNLHRAVGTDGSGKYSYLLTSNDVLKSYYESKKDLPYPLRKEVKRDRYIYNADGLQKDLIEIVNNAIQEAEKELSNLVSDDIVNMVYDKINGVVGAVSNKTKATSKAAAIFGRTLAKSLMNGLSKIYNDITNPN
jgi:hypothetical protein